MDAGRILTEYHANVAVSGISKDVVVGDLDKEIETRAPILNRLHGVVLAINQNIREGVENHGATGWIHRAKRHPLTFRPESRDEMLICLDKFYIRSGTHL